MLQIKLNAYTFNYFEKGNGSHLVFVHGSASDYRTWQKTQMDMGKYYQTIAYSRRFHWPNEKISGNEDYSMAQHVADLESFLKFMGNETVHLVGHSYGAFVCLLLAAKNPELIRTLTLAEPPVITLFVSNIPKLGEILKLLLSKPRTACAIIKLGAKGFGPASVALKKGNMNKALDFIGKATMGTNAYENLSDSRLEQARSNLIKEELLGSGFPPLDKEKIAQIELPTLFISGEKSPKLFHYLIDGLQQLIPHSERKMIPNASHIMHEDNVHDYNSALFSFLQKHEN